VVMAPQLPLLKVRRLCACRRVTGLEELLACECRGRVEGRRCHSALVTYNAAPHRGFRDASKWRSRQSADPVPKRRNRPSDNCIASQSLTSTEGDRQ
jgi:hypothetical protein